MISIRIKMKDVTDTMVRRSKAGLVHQDWSKTKPPKFVYYKWIKRELERRPIFDCRCDERSKTKAEGSTRLTYTGLVGGPEHLKIETRLIDEMFASVSMCS
jgi:hypothetical protein